jgi:hypothetical protein
MMGGRRLFEVPSPIFIILVHQKWSDFSTILVLMVLFSMPGTKQQSSNRSMASIDGVDGASWVWGVGRTNMGAFFVSELVPDIPPSEQP